MSIKTRKYMYQIETVDNNEELDYLDTPLDKLDLSTLQTVMISGPFVNRPDLISLKMYGNYHMGWLIALHNDFLDPVFDFYLGREIDIPDLDEYYRFYNANSRSR